MKFAIFAAFLATTLVGCKPSLERQVVGTWKGDAQRTSMKVDDPLKEAAFKSMVGITKLEVREDKTFTLDAGTLIRGKWSLSGNKLVLAAGGSARDSVDFVVDGDTMTFSGENPTLQEVLVKSG